MVLIKMDLSAEECVEKRETFVVDSIVPLAIKPTAIKDQYLMLFATCEECDDKYMYFQILLQSENEADKHFFDNHYLNMNNLKSNNFRLEAYMKFMKNLSNNNLFFTDFSMTKAENSSYYCSIGTRTIGENKACNIEIYFPVKSFVKLKLYLERFIKMPYIGTRHEDVFRDDSYNNIIVENIESIKMDCTKAELNGRATSTYTTHYTVNIGIKIIYKFNHTIVAETNKNVKHNMDSKLYDDLYSNDTFVGEIFSDDKFVYFVYREKSIDGSLKSIKLLKLDLELANRNTNLFNHDNIFIKENNGDKL